MEAILFHSSNTSEQPLWQQRLLLAQSPLALLTKASPQRQIAESFIANRFLASYGANLQNFLPFLLASTNAGQINAALGIQPATSKPLFLEQYLDKPIELLLPEKPNAIDREDIVEIGNLAASFQTGSPLLFIIVAAILDAADFRYVVFTATSQIRRLLEKLQLATDVIGPADPGRLSDKGQSWGRYYQHQPVILGGSLSYAVNHLRQHKVIQTTLEHYADFIRETADMVRTHE